MEEETKIVPPPEEKTEISPPPEEVTEAAPPAEASAAGPAAEALPSAPEAEEAAAPDRPSPPVRERTGNSALGALGAFAGACIGALPYVLVGVYFSILSGWLCFLIAFCAAKGYDLAGGRRGVVRTLITAVLSTAAVFVATYCMHVLSIMRAFTETGWEVPGFFQMLSPAWQLIMDPETEMLGPAVRDLCFGILFNFVGLYFFSDRRKKADTRPAE